jgi:hypothetical protein
MATAAPIRSLAVSGGGVGGDFSEGGEAGGADRTIGNTDNFDLGILTNNTNRIHIQNDGSVGLGVTDPDTLLELFKAGDQLKLSFDADSFATFSLDTNDDLTIKPAAAGGIRLQPTTTDTTDFLQVLDQDGGVPVLNVDAANERVGIGTATPIRDLQVLNSSGDVFGVFESTNGVGNWLSFFSGSANHSVFLWSDVNHLRFGTSTSSIGAGFSESMRITSSGDLLVGTLVADADDKVVINGPIRIDDTGAQPTCDSGIQGMFWYEEGGAGVKDTVDVCAKDAGDAYAWRSIY